MLATPSSELVVHLCGLRRLQNEILMPSLDKLLALRGDIICGLPVVIYAVGRSKETRSTKNICGSVYLPSAVVVLALSCRYISQCHHERCSGWSAQLTGLLELWTPCKHNDTGLAR